jgi:thiamine biosynthesis lipoprotein
MSRVLPTITALGTTWIVELFDEVTEEKADKTHGLIRLFLSDFESKYSRFKPDSTISTINRTKKIEQPDETTLELLRLGQQLYQDTGGIFNFLIGEQLIARGYDSDYSFVPKTEPADFPNPLTDLDITDSEITLGKGLIDLGGYGKGYLIDRLADCLQELGFNHLLINGGGDMYATSDHGEPITIYLEHPTEPGTYIAETTLKDQGFAASSTHKRRWKVSGKEYSHIVDTTARRSTNQSDNHPDEFGIYVKAPTAVLADAWSTTLLLAEPEIHHNHLYTHQVHFGRFDINKSSLYQSVSF